ncbi:LysR family transcriptional regulator [Paenibacillus sp. SYP-B3998]|uniref:LysR family transcriptional regulator n=1 Tax=Paenibacillus sp. SYP-B3998 TaxID=2678564 RepID=A0A6G3ZYK1_9BACL|nr:LysR family transcriptional regulator [Paenibacillus sp. SYP-B3998]NEW06659.1 LysR family transcriptional regulator [Paenibacillus sp. SYP-B3998]
MDIKQLRYFIAIAEEKQITAAAKKLHMAQPPLSQQLKLLEQDLGTKLFEKRGRFLQLTEAGTTLYHYAVKITKDMEEAHTEVTQIGHGVRGKLSIGVNTISYYHLPKLLQAFRQTYPHISYKIQQNESAQLAKLVKEKVIELAIIRLPLMLDDFAVLQLQKERFYFVSSEPLAQDNNQITLNQIQEYPLILPSTDGLGIFHLILEEFRIRNLTPHIIGECSDISILMELVSSGFGSTIVPETVLKKHRGYRVQAYEIEDSEVTASSALIWLKQHYLSKAAQRFVELLLAESKDVRQD